MGNTVSMEKHAIEKHVYTQHAIKSEKIRLYTVLLIFSTIANYIEKTPQSQEKSQKKFPSERHFLKYNPICAHVEDSCVNSYKIL